MSRQLVNLFLLITGPLTVFGQVSNEVQVYLKPGTQVHVFENMVNSNSGDFEVGDGGLLYVDGTLVNQGSMTFNNASSLLRGSSGSDGTGAGTHRAHIGQQCSRVKTHQQGGQSCGAQPSVHVQLHRVHA